MAVTELEVAARRSGLMATPAAEAAIEAAQSLLAAGRRQRALAALDDLFRSGLPPAPALHGRYEGTLLALDVAPLTSLAEQLAARWMPWQGKRFDAAHGCGDNLFSSDSRWLATLVWPLYRDYKAEDSTSYRAFAFRTQGGEGREDPDREVLQIIYDLPRNPRWTVRRVLDELVQVADGLYLGKAHLRWWWGRWQRVAFFLLRDGALPPHRMA